LTGLKLQKKITNIDITTYTIGLEGDIIYKENNLKDIFGIESDGAILFRPDGYVAWRMKEKCSDISNVLENVFRTLLANNITLKN